MSLSNLRRTATLTVVVLGALVALYGIYLAFFPMLLDAEHTAPLGAAASETPVRDALAFASFQIALLTVAWGAFVAGLAPAAIERGDSTAQAALWIGGVGVSVGTLLRMASIGDWAGVAFNAIPALALAVALLAPALDARAPRRLAVRERASASAGDEREAPPPRTL